MGVTVTFVAILELMREGLIEVVQAQSYAPLHVRAVAPTRTLHLVADEPRADTPAAGSEPQPQVTGGAPDSTPPGSAGSAPAPVDEDRS